jgi:uncharacterized protein (TIGR02996 family)
VKVFERGGVRREVVVETSSIKAKWDYDRECRRLRAEGWLLVAGDAEELASQPELIAALRADPEDVDTYAILADWLSEHDDPWGQLMAIQIAIARLPRFGASARRDELEREETRLRFVHAARIWGRLGEQILDEATQHYACDAVDVEWFCGFIRSARISDDVDLVIATLPDLAIARLLRSLELRADAWQRRTFDRMSVQQWPELRTLKITTTSGEIWGDPAAVDALWIVPALEATPRLTELAVYGSHSTDGLCIALAANAIGARLERLVLMDGQFTDQGIAALASGNLKLRDLHLVGNGPANARAMLEGVAKTVTVNFGENYD